MQSTRNWCIFIASKFSPTFLLPRSIKTYRNQPENCDYIINEPNLLRLSCRKPVTVIELTPGSTAIPEGKVEVYKNSKFKARVSQGFNSAYIKYINS